MTERDDRSPDDIITESTMELERVKGQWSLVNFIYSRLNLHLKENTFADRLYQLLEESKK